MTEIDMPNIDIKELEEDNYLPKEDKVLCTFIGSKKLNNVIKSRGNKLNITKNEMYRNIVDDYFEKNHISDSEKELYL